MTAPSENLYVQWVIRTAAISPYFIKFTTIHLYCFPKTGSSPHAGTLPTHFKVLSEASPKVVLTPFMFMHPHPT